MTDRIYNALFLCTGNSARSIMAEAVLNRAGRGRFRAFSAGSHPTGRVSPRALELLANLGFPTADMRSKSWDEFARPGAPQMDFVITVCDNAAGEICPVWPGQPISAHWGFPDPAAMQGTPAEIAAHFADVFRMIRTRIEIFTALPLASLDRLAIKREVDALASADNGVPA